MRWFFKILAFLALIGEAVDFVQDDWAAFGVGVSDFLCLSHTLDQEAEYGDQERDFG
jgi:hypothetical protein